MQKIIMATDFSAPALNAANYAADMAMATHAELLLLHVFHLPAHYHEVAVERNEYDFLKDAKKEMDQLRMGLWRRTQGKVSIKSEVVHALFFEGLQKACERINPSLVVMGIQGASSAENILLGRGSHAIYTRQHLRWPLITVPKDALYAPSPKKDNYANLAKVYTIPIYETSGNYTSDYINIKNVQ